MRGADHLRTPKGWTGPSEVDSHKVEGFWHAHQVPMMDVVQMPAHLHILEQWIAATSRQSCSMPMGCPCRTFAMWL